MGVPFLGVPINRIKSHSISGGILGVPLFWEMPISSTHELLVRLKAKAPLTVRDARGQSLLHAAWPTRTLEIAGLKGFS